MSAPAPPVRLSLPEDPVRTSAPPAPFSAITALVTEVRAAKDTVPPELAFTTRVSVPPPATPATDQACPVIWLPAKVAVRPSLMMMALRLEKDTALTSTLAVNWTVLVPAPPSTVSPAAASTALA